MIQAIDVVAELERGFSNRLPFHRDHVRVLKDYWEGKLKPFAQYSDGEYRVEIVPTTAEGNGTPPRGQKLLFKEGDPNPIPTGWWMDWPEKHWNIPEETYQQLPREKRAELEAREQVVHWAAKEYDYLREQLDFENAVYGEQA